jgi:Putative auto-transporter adhesin, head GIN domain
MKKIGLLIFISALVIGSIFANSMDFGRFSIGSMFFNRVEGSGVLKAEKREVSGFSKIDGSGAINVEIVIQNDFSVEVEADDNLLQNIKTEVSGDTLKIYSEGRLSRKNPVNVKIGMPSIEGLEINGASKANALNIKSDELFLKANGASKITIGGEVKNLESRINGASTVDAENLKSENVQIKVNGASKATVFATNRLEANANGASRITYIGEPTNLEKRANGASSINSK